METIVSAWEALMKLQYTLWLKDPKGNWLYEWANVFKSAEDARAYRKHLDEGLRPGHQWVVVEKEVGDEPGSFKAYRMNPDEIIMDEISDKLGSSG